MINPNDARFVPRCAALVLGLVGLGLAWASNAVAQTGLEKPEASASVKPAAVPRTMHKSPYRATATPHRATLSRLAEWGVDNLKVNRTNSGNLIRFSYRVVEPKLATALREKKSEPALVAPSRGVSLQVPTMENVGSLRNTTEFKAGRDYWVIFSNKGNYVRAGDRVNVVIGNFHADGLVVQ